MVSLTFLIVVLLVLWLGAQVLTKAGYSAWWTLVLIVPLVNIIMLWIFAFGKWPIERMRQ